MVERRIADSATPCAEGWSGTIRGLRLPEALSCLAVTAPGVAPITARELRSLGIPSTAVGVEGVSFRSSLKGLYTAQLWLRTASRVVVRIAEFRVETFYELERFAARVPWPRYISEGSAVRIRVSCRKSRLYHSDAVAERVGRAIGRSGAKVVAAPSDAAGTDDTPGALQLVVVRLYRDVCTLSMDASGALLHRRGYRQETAKAPLRETLAAALLMAAGWGGEAALLDPLCGSGTIAIEGAWMARRRAPGLGRDFALMHWPAFDRGVWEQLIDEAHSRELPRCPVRIQASDRDAGATAAAARNAERAGVGPDIEITTRGLSAIEPPESPGWLATNPPYGIRVGESDRLRDLYAQLGHVTRAKCQGWVVALLAADRSLARHTRLPLRVRLRTTNGGIPVEVLTAEVARANRARERK